MRYSEFQEWLEENGMANRSARDVVSRSRRVLLLTKQEKIDKDSMMLLLEKEEFLQCSMCIKSQLKRAIVLYLDFSNVG